MDSRAAEKARVNQPRVNVRGQAAMGSEVVTQLQKDEEVLILEEITLAKPKAGEPAKWAKIKMPLNTPVWVYAPLVKDRATALRKLNLRAGPGENYSVVGSLEKGESIKEIRSLEDWVEIETPANAYAFLDANLLTKSGVAVATQVEKPILTPPVVAIVQPVAVVALKTESLLDPPPVVIAEIKPEPTPTLPVVAPPAIVATNTAPALPVLPVVIVPTLESTVVEAGPAPRRIVRREGTVRSTRFNIQAPTYYELVSSEGNIGINYLQSEKSGLKLRDFRGKKVVVSGEESLDRRYPSRPIMEIETIETAP